MSTQQKARVLSFLVYKATNEEYLLAGICTTQT